MNTASEFMNKKPKRLPVTASVMRLLKLELSKIEENKQDIRLYWTVSCIAFFGGFRIHELLCRKQDSFDPSFSLLGKDLKLVTSKVNNSEHKVIQLKLKSPKENKKGTSIIIDVYANLGDFCPVKALEKWMKTAIIDMNLPLFRKTDGTPLTGRKFNIILKNCLSKHIPYEAGSISSHSFRAGIASLMGTLGYSENEIKSIGRWSSKCFQDYIKLPRTRRLEMAKQLGNLNL